MDASAIVLTDEQAAKSPRLYPTWAAGWQSSPVIGSTIPATTGSTKKFKITVTDDGTLTATEVTQ